jgi:sialate O-acetylesterase
VPNTGLAVTIDIGDPHNIHPTNKQDVGKRLSLIALANAYQRKIEFSGPIYRSMEVSGSEVRLSFTHAAGLTAKDGAPKTFVIAGQDQKFVPAEAKVDGTMVVVSSPLVAAPVAVRYAWANNPEGCNLYNSDGLPASPFRTDDWQLRTQAR